MGVNVNLEIERNGFVPDVVGSVLVSIEALKE